MRFAEIELVLSAPRMARYAAACGGDTRKAMTLYRKNLALSGELFTIISCFEIALRNKIDGVYSAVHGHDWLRDSANPGAIFDVPNCDTTRRIIRTAVNKLGRLYTHNKLVAEMDFGFWRYLFAQPQFLAGGQTLLGAFPAKPRSTPAIQYNHTYVFNELGRINELRNRIAHHEPVCFAPGGGATINTVYVRQHYTLILQLFQWMTINESALLYGLDHVNSVCTEIDAF